MDNTERFRFRLHLERAADNKLHRVTDQFFRANTPPGIPHGNYLYFLSVHDFAPLISQVEFNFATNRRPVSSRWHSAKT